MKFILLKLSVALALICHLTQAQILKTVPKEEISVNLMPIICYGSEKNVNGYLPPPKEYLERLKNHSARTQTTNLNIVYDGFPLDNQAKNSLQAALDIWKSLIQTPVTVNILVRWRSITSNTPGLTTLAFATWGSVHANFDGAPKLNVYYPAALADKIAGRNLNNVPLNITTGSGFDIIATFNSQIAWNFTATTPQANKTHLTTVALHEFGHGLGFTDSFDVDNLSIGSFGIGPIRAPIIFDVSVENETARAFNQPNNSSNLASALTSQNVTYNSPQAMVANGGTKPQLYAPDPYVPGSSIAHLDQTRYSGTINSLLKPIIDRQEVTLDPGPIVKSIFSDMGWQAPSITHIPLTDTETVSEPFDINAVIASDGSSGYSINPIVKLRYTINNGAEQEITMTQGLGNNYSAQLPVPISIPTSYAYYMVITDNLNRTFTNPGKIVEPGKSDSQAAYQFKAGPDITAPIVVHKPIDFIREGTALLNLNADATDNIGIKDISVLYQINSNTIQNLNLTQDNDTLSLYKGSISTVGLVDGDNLKYRVVATDNSSNSNQAALPSLSEFYTVAVVGIAPSKDNYLNDFNSPSSDFFGNGYSITTPSGFANGAIHSIHPYPEAGNGATLNFIYQLKIPIKVKAQEATIKFDEIVLVEPGEAGFNFGAAEFFDYVVVEGSKNGGATWVPFADGYDSRDYTPWLTKYNSNIVSSISQAAGDPSLFRSRTLNMLNKFAAGDEVVIRFRLFSDPGAAGWGWAIDNLKIQIDDTPPTVFHNHLDFTTDKSQPLVIAMKATDGSGLKSLAVEYKVNTGSTTSSSLPVSANVSDYTFNLDIAAASVGDDVQYRIRAVDNLNNEVVLPSTDFFHVPIITLGTPIAQYTSDFNSTNLDFKGNFFSVSTPSGFANGAIHSSHPYPHGFGLTNSTSALSLTLIKPITISTTNPNMVFDEIGIIEPINDYAIVEGSKDNGVTWKPFLTDYGATAQSSWTVAYNTNAGGTPSLYKNRFINLTQNGNFKSGDQVLIRFRLNTNSTINAWGWAIDNLSIQGLITGFEKTITSESLSIFPSPSRGEKITVQFSTTSDAPVSMQILNAQGQAIQTNEFTPVSNFVRHEYNANEWTNGMYFLKIDVGNSVVTKKFIKSE